MKKAVGFLLVVGGFIFITLITVDWHGDMFVVIIDAPALLWKGFAISGVLLMTGEGKTFIAAVNAVLSRKYVLPEVMRIRAIRLFKMMIKVVWGSAVVAIMMTVMLILVQLENPAALGPMLSVSLSSALYAALINLVFFHPAIIILENRRNEAEKIVISEKQVIDKLLELCYRQGITPEEIMNAEEIGFKGEGEQ